MFDGRFGDSVFLRCLKKKNQQKTLSLKNRFTEHVTVHS